MEILFGRELLGIRFGMQAQHPSSSLQRTTLVHLSCKAIVHKRLLPTTDLHALQYHSAAGNMVRRNGNLFSLMILILVIGVFKTQALWLYNYCAEYLDQLLSSDTSLICLFTNSILPAAAFNFGPQTVCQLHIDFSNLPFNWCWIQALGWYDWCKGGHIILWDLQVVVEFPPGTLPAIPLGVCHHSNMCIQRREE